MQGPAPGWDAPLQLLDPIQDDDVTTTAERGQPATSSPTGSASTQYALDLRQRVEAALIDAVAELLQRLPRFGGFEVLGPEWKRTALAWPCGIDGAAVVPEDTVAVRFKLQHRVPVFVFREKPLLELAWAEFEKPGDALDLLRAHVDPPRLCSAAAVIALMTRKLQSARVPRNCSLRSQDGTL